MEQLRSEAQIRFQGMKHSVGSITRRAIEPGILEGAGVIAILGAFMDVPIQQARIAVEVKDLIPPTTAIEMKQAQETMNGVQTKTNQAIMRGEVMIDVTKLEDAEKLRRARETLQTEAMHQKQRDEMIAEMKTNINYERSVAGYAGGFLIGAIGLFRQIRSFSNPRKVSS